MSVELESERLRLRQFREEDFDIVVVRNSDPELTRYLGGPMQPVESWRWLLSMLGHWQLRGYGYFALETKDHGDFCGCAGLIRHYDWPEMELGWRVYPEWQGKGLATEAGERIRRYAYGALKRDTLVSYIHADNVASKRVALKLGAVHEATITLRGEPAEVFRHPPSNTIN